ncbi:membrane protein [Fulvivirga sp. M361]|uniref:7TM-DISM domain-containing protein n=1 Tax=Fulvivirga sp. M361 TaxID=2594266 RepID=UPI0011798D9E|nr:7TM-DISM domain-containing protein [Fulvivirga sp. M361]TRX62602.1 membrane protein [Fulvivirga sp. M361]
MLKSAVIAFLVVLSLGNSFSQNSRQAKVGVIDLSDLKFSHQEIIPLIGQWEFYWHHLLSSDDSIRAMIPDLKYMVVPNVWSFYDLPSKGYGTYRLKMLLHEDVDRLTLLVPNVYSAYRLFVNGEIKAENGQVGNSRASTQPDWEEKLVHLEGLNKEVELLLQVANFHHSRGGVHKPILVGSFEDILKHRELITFGDTFFLGGLILMAAYFLTFFIFRSKLRQYLYFSCLCFFWAIRVVIAHDYLVNNLFPDMSWNVSLRLEYLSLYLSFLMGMLFIHHVFQYSKVLFTGILNIINFIFIVSALVLPTDIFTLLLKGFFIFAGLGLINALYVIIQAIYKKQPEAWFSATGIAVGVVIFFIEYIAYNHSSIINLLYLNMAYLAVFFINGLVLIHGFVQAHHRIDTLESERSSLYRIHGR